MDISSMEASLIRPWNWYARANQAMFGLLWPSMHVVFLLPVSYINMLGSPPAYKRKDNRVLVEALDSPVMKP